MVSTRSHSVLSADAAHADTATTHGEVTSTAPTPRRSGRRRTTATAATPVVEKTPARSSRRLRPIQEEEQATEQQHLGQQQALEQEEQQQQQQAPEQQWQQVEVEADPEPEQQAAAAAQAGADDRQLLTAGAGVVETLAHEMFAALDSVFGQREQHVSGSDSEPHDEPGSPEAIAAATAGAGQQQAQASGPSEGDGDSGSSASGTDSESEGPADRVPSHLRWRPDLALPGVDREQQDQGGAAAAAAAAGHGVHVVHRAKDGLHLPAPDARAQQRAARKDKPDTAGKGWFDLPATQITDEVKNDLRMLRLRGALDPKSFYKKFDSTKFPKYFQMGTVVEGPTDFYSGRLTNKQRKRTFTEEIMADEHLAEVRKKRYNKLQEERSYWSKKKAGRKTENERKKKPHHRAKH